MSERTEEEQLIFQGRVLESMTEGLNVCDTDARILFTNLAFDEMFGYEPGELIDQHASVLNAGTMEDNARAFKAITTALEKGEPWRGEINSKKKDGTPFPTFARISVLEVSGKTYWLNVREDITERKRLEREDQLRSDRDKLEEAVERQMAGKNPYKLTFREFTVLHLAAEGEADKAIADRLGISSTTVSKHMGIILKKMAATSRTEACVRALREGFIS